jgi:hypothetical protein
MREKPTRFVRVNTVAGKYLRQLVFLPFCPQQLNNNKQSYDKEI